MERTEVPFFAFRDWPEGIALQVDVAIAQAIRQKQFILGPAVTTFEEAFSNYIGTEYAVGVGNGYDALVIALKALGVKGGDEVIVPANTFIATINAVHQVGATPVLADPDTITYNLTASRAAEKITARTKAIIPVHLYGQPCDMDQILQLANDKGLKIIEDAAQAHGATYKDQLVGSLGNIGAFSFYPTKNLGALGDAGAVVTADKDIAVFMQNYRNYGEQKKYQNEIAGINSRLDTLQAAILCCKLPYLEKFNAERRRLAQIYLDHLKETGDIILPSAAPGCGHVYHIFSIRTKHRDALQNWLAEHGIKTAVHYPVPAHKQPAYRHLGYKSGDLPVTEQLAATSLSLPLFPGLLEKEQMAVIAGIKRYFDTCTRL